MPAVVVYCLLYAGGIGFLAGCAIRAVRYAKAPVHLRWEIYPVPKGRAAELKVMAPEILFLKGLWDFNRRMWFASYPFHLGLYLLGISGALIAIDFAAAPVSPSWLPGAYVACGASGAVLGLAGSLALLARRIADRKLRKYSTPADYFNLLFFATVYALLIVGEGLKQSGSPGIAALLRGAATFQTDVEFPLAISAGMAAGALLLVYIPATHMSHFIAKYFTYHAIRWDERGVSAGAIGAQIAESLMYRPTWSASHVGATGERTWTEIAAADPARGGAK